MPAMSDVGFSEFRQNLATHFDAVIESRAPLLVTRRGSESAYVVAAAEFEAMQETIHLLRSPANAKRLLEAIAELDAGKGIETDPTAE
jgi:antitoxin YefM